tara:strand:- start:2 stop:406 length:405 start_codon:yes stop_codon:yes gene_type:complete
MTAMKDKGQKSEEEDTFRELKNEAVSRYRSATMKMSNIERCTRPDISYTVHNWHRIRIQQRETQRECRQQWRLWRTRRSILPVYTLPALDIKVKEIKNRRMGGLGKKTSSFIIRICRIHMDTPSPSAYGFYKCK